MNGRGTAWVSPSTVMCRSSITSNIAAWVFGEARLISSARTMLVNTGPGRKRNVDVGWSSTRPPVTSAGSRSGVNWIRRHPERSEMAIALASVVLPVPGTSSSSR